MVRDEIIYDDVQINNLIKLTKVMKLNLDIDNYNGNKKELIKNLLEKMNIINGYVFFKNKSSKKKKKLKY